MTIVSIQPLGVFLTLTRKHDIAVHGWRSLPLLFMAILVWVVNVGAVILTVVFDVGTRTTPPLMLPVFLLAGVLAPGQFITWNSMRRYDLSQDDTLRTQRAHSLFPA